MGQKYRLQNQKRTGNSIGIYTTDLWGKLIADVPNTEEGNPLKLQMVNFAEKIVEELNKS